MGGVSPGLLSATTPAKRFTTLGLFPKLLANVRVMQLTSARSLRPHNVS